MCNFHSSIAFVNVAVSEGACIHNCIISHDIRPRCSFPAWYNFSSPGINSGHVQLFQSAGSSPG
jgi:hypothetical protein